MRRIFGLVTTMAVVTLVGCTPEVPAEPTRNAMTDPRIRITAPLPDAEITSPLRIRGEARGGWYFEATFPIVLVDWDGLIIAEGYAQAEGEWMIDDFVPFSAELSFTKPSFNPWGTLILQKSNPSGLPEYDAATEIPIRFK